MKRTRRIEITSYSRRVRVIQHNDATIDSAAVLSTIEVSAEVRQAIVSALEKLDEDELRANQPAVVQKSRRLPFNSLRIWLRQVLLQKRQRVTTAPPSLSLPKKSL